ncbi:MAG: type II toxin-antitoxin system VapC family toxin [Pyrinomonadaceae bacterium]
MSFWDSSAIAPLCANESRSQLTRTTWRRFSEHYVWRETIVEVESSLARLTREGILTETLRPKADKRLSLIESEWKIVEPNQRLIDLARTFPNQYGLKAMDSLQLAAALVWCREFP